MFFQKGRSSLGYYSKLACLTTTLIACGSKSDPPPNDTGTTVTIPPIEWGFTTITSPNVGDGFGTAIAISSDNLYVGAPHGEVGGLVYIHNQTDSLASIMQGSPGDALGASLAFFDKMIYSAAPLSDAGAGTIYSSDGVAITGDSGQLLGKRLYATGNGLFTSSTAGLFRIISPALGQIVPSLDLEFVAPSARIGGFIASGEELFIGTPYGEVSVLVGEESLPRLVPLDEAGYSLCWANLFDDDEEELVVGAPGASRVDLFSRTDSGEFELKQSISSTNDRFGHALSCAEGILIVGAPLYGSDQRGAVWRFEGDPLLWTTEEPFLEGAEAWSQLGFSVRVNMDKELFMGAPGIASTAGYVSIFAPINP
jgi:hypothetical protein